MKSSKVFLIGQCVLMYVIQVPFYLVLIFAHIEDFDTNIIIYTLLVGVILLLVSFVFDLASYVIAIRNIFKSSENPLKTTFIAKLALIPWYLFNIVVCILLISGFLNPFLLVAVPLIIAIEVGLTYCLLVSSSVHSIAYVIHYYLDTKQKPSSKIITACILHFIFVLDVIGSYILYKEFAKINK